MMKRYYSHYTIIHPSLFLKNHVVELDEENRLIRYYPYQNEIRNTEFYSGLLIFVSLGQALDFSFIQECWNSKQIERLESFFEMKGMEQPLSLKKETLKMLHIA